ncbi:MAG: hypothetical protein ACKO91_05075 [Acidimicrobiales bacterium]
MAAAVDDTEPGSERRSVVVFALAAAVAFVFRFGSFWSAGVPSGPDPGNWLAYGWAALGQGVRPLPTAYPPLVPVLTVAVTSVVGIPIGVMLLGAGSGIAPALGTWWLLRRVADGWIAAAAGGALLCASAIGEATAWGGYPQLLSLGLWPVALVGLVRCQHGGRARWIDGLCVAAIGATSHLTLVVVGVHACFHAAGALALAAGHRRVLARSYAGWCVRVAVCCVPLVFVYRDLVRTVLVSSWNRMESASPGLGDHLGSMQRLFREADFGWQLAVVVAAAAPVLLVGRRRDPVWLLVSSGFATWATCILMLRESRFHYLLPQLTVVGLAAWSAAVVAVLVRVGFAWARWPLRAVVGALAVAVAWQGAVFFELQRSYYTVVGPGSFDGFAYLRDRTPPGAVVAVPPVRGGPFGWWVEGAGRRPALAGSLLVWLNVAEERERARKSQRIFETFPDPSSFQRARDAGVSYLFLPAAWDGFAGLDPAVLEAAGGIVVVANPDVLVVAVGTP